MCARVSSYSCIVVVVVVETIVNRKNSICGGGGSGRTDTTSLPKSFDTDERRRRFGVRSKQKARRRSVGQSVGELSTGSPTGRPTCARGVDDGAPTLHSLSRGTLFTAFPSTAPLTFRNFRRRSKKKFFEFPTLDFPETCCTVLNVFKRKSRLLSGFSTASTKRFRM